jgi:Xaa-Pro aminopeptidase
VATAPNKEMTRAEELAAKRERVAGLLDGYGLDAVLLRTRANIAWLGCGPADGVPFDLVQGSRSEIWAQGETGVAVFVVTRGGVTLVTENIELPRIARDEFGDLPIEVVAQPWHESDLARATAAIVADDGARIGTDLAEPSLADAAADAGFQVEDLRGEIAALRASLLPRELDRYRWLGRTAAEVMSEICRGITPGMREAEIVSDAHRRLRRLGIAQEVDIVCSDDRLMVDRHGLYGDYAIERMSMVVFCAHKWGLVANLTRMIHFGPVPDQLQRRHGDLSAFDLRIMEATRPAVPLAEIFTDVIQPGYAALGEPEAWRDHHQGGSTGYTGRDQRVTPTTAGVVQPDQAYAWNPSLPGIKSEDTFVVAPDGPDVLTLDPSWPVHADSGRPRIAELPTR